MLRQVVMRILDQQEAIGGDYSHQIHQERIPLPDHGHQNQFSANILFQIVLTPDVGCELLVKLGPTCDDGDLCGVFTLSLLSTNYHLAVKCCVRIPAPMLRCLFHPSYNVHFNF
jgi:hypothetical protein